MRTDWIASRLPGRGRILDLGFAGEHSEAVHRELKDRLPGAYVIGLDLNADRVRALGLPRTVIGDAFSLPFAAETFDALVVAEVLEHLPEPTLLLPELARVLKTGAPLVITSPNPYELSRWLRHWLFATDAARGPNVRGYLGNDDHKGFLEPLSFCDALRRNGLEPSALRTVKFHVPLLGRLLSRPIVLAGDTFLLNRLGAYLCIEARKRGGAAPAP